ncbi:MAG: glycosyltransferase family 2 protein [Phycisphaerae bacterium]|nr:glycosyltransferase family 2 protein [Phycisphaerae bacterium]
MKNASDNNEYQVSVIIPAYNAENQIATAIQSILDQKHKAFEIIVVDDGSTDNTAEIVKKFGDPVKYIHQENSGVSTTCNTGIKAAKGNWIAFLDSDDYWFPDKLLEQISLLKRNQHLHWATCNFVFHNYSNNTKKPFWEIGKSKKLLQDKEYFNDAIVAFNMGMSLHRSCMLVKKASLEKSGYFDPQISSAEDLDIFIRFAYHFPEIGYITTSMANYVYNSPGSLSNRPYNKKMSVISKFIMKHLELSKKFNKYESFKIIAINQLRFKCYVMYRQGFWLDTLKIIRKFRSILPMRYYYGLLFSLFLLPRKLPFSGKLSRIFIGKI